MKYDILLGLTRLLTVTVIVGKMTNDLAAQILNEERRKRKLKTFSGYDITFLPTVEG